MQSCHTKPLNLEIRPFTPGLPGFPCQIFIEAEMLHGQRRADTSSGRVISQTWPRICPLLKLFLISQRGVIFPPFITLTHFKNVTSEQLLGGLGTVLFQPYPPLLSLELTKSKPYKSRNSLWCHCFG